MVDRPNIWTEGSREMYPVGGFELAGLGVYFPAPEASLLGSVWGVSEEYGDGRVDRCRAFMSVPGPLQSVQRAEFWGAVLALQAYYPCHLGIDNLNLSRTIVGCLIMGPYPSLYHWSRMVILCLLFCTCSMPGGLIRFGLLRLKVMLLRLMVILVGSGWRIGLETWRLMLLLLLGRMHQDAEKVDARRSLLCARDLWSPSVHGFCFPGFCES